MGDVFGLTQAKQSIQQALDQSNPTMVADLLRLLKLGTMLSPLKITFSGLTSAAAQAIFGAGAGAVAAFSLGTVLAADALAGAQQIPLTVFPPILSVIALRVTAGGATAGARIVTDAGGTAGAPGANGPGIALLSDDGTTLTFEAALTGFVIEYIPRPNVNMAANFDDLNQVV